MNKRELENLIENFKVNGKTATELNAVRSEIFNALDNYEIKVATKDNLLKDLYSIAQGKGVFFIRLTERKTQGLPKNDEEEAEWEESYEQSYSYDEDDEEEEEDDDEEEK